MIPTCDDHSTCMKCRFSDGLCSVDIHNPCEICHTQCWGATSAMQSAGSPHSAAFQPMTVMQWSNQPTSYASPFVAPPAWPMYMPSCMPRPLTHSSFLQAQFEELARRNHDMEA